MSADLQPPAMNAAFEPHAASAETRPPPMPVVNEVGFDDIAEALRAGVRDFRRAPQYGLALAAFFTLGGWLMWWFGVVIESPWLIIPLAITFPLVGPFAAVGLYEVSRRLEAGEPLSWGAILGRIAAQRRRQIVWIAYVMLFITLIWALFFRTIFAVFLAGEFFDTVERFLAVVLTTEAGITFLIVGTAVGGFLAFILFSTTVVSIPLLLERDRDFITAIITSWKAVFASFVPMLAWGALVTALVMLGALTAFVGLLVILPVLGHATWHLHRRAVVPATDEIP